MEHINLKQLAKTLSQSDQYKVLEKYQKPEFYNVDDSSNKLIGVFLDTETTGLSYEADKVIELGMVKFEYNQDGYIFRLLDEFNEYQDPGIPIPEVVTKLTGITDDTVRGQHIDESKVVSYLSDVDIIIAHNARFDRTFLETTFPSILPKAWGCSMYDIDWRNEGVLSHKLEYIAYRYGFFYEAHRAIADSLAGIHILAQSLFNSKQPVLKQLLASALSTRFKLWAINSPYESKDALKTRGYKWNNNNGDKPKAWYIELTEDKVEEEINYLRSNIYKQHAINIPIDIFDAYSRFSSKYEHLPNSKGYQDKLDWVKMLCSNKHPLSKPVK